MNKPIPLLIYENLHQEPSTVFVEGRVNIRSYTLSIDGYSISICDSNAVNLLIQEMANFYNKELDNLEEESERIIKSLTRQLENEKSKYETLSRNLQSDHDRQLEKYNKAIEENRKYREWYGTLISPILIIKELWNEGQRKELDFLVPPNQWKTGKGLGGEAGTTAKRYWLSMLQEWGMIKQWGRGKYMANIGMYEALELLNRKMKKQGLIPDEKGIDEQAN